jgi:hypothetical protein
VSDIEPPAKTEPSASAELEERSSNEPLPASVEHMRPLGDVFRGDVLEIGIRLELLRRAIRGWWLLPVGSLLTGAGLGAWIQGAHMNVGTAICLAAGIALLIGALMNRAERTENLHNLCEAYMRFVDRWPSELEGHRTNSAYIQAEASKSDVRPRTHRAWLRFRRKSAAVT